MAKLRINTIYDGGQEGSIANMINSLKTSIEKMQQQSFMRGVSGESVKSKVVSFKEILELAKVYDSNGYEVTDINGKINRIFSIDQSSEWRITNSNSLKDIDNDWWYDKVKAMKFTVFYTGENTITNTPFLVFVDPRLEYINKYVNSGNCEFNDKSCIIAIRGNVSDDDDIKIEISPIFPRLYYNEGARSFCWEINGERTSVSAQGISGKDGESASIKEVTAIYKNNEGDKKVYNIETTPNDTLIILTYNDGDKKYTCFDSSVTEYMDSINDGTMCIINILGVSDEAEYTVDGYNNGKLLSGSEEIANVSTADVTFGVAKKNLNDNTIEIITNNIKFRNFIKTISGSAVFSDLELVTFGNVEAEANNANTISFKANNDAYNNIVSSFSTDNTASLSFVHGTHAQKAYKAANKDEYYKQMIGTNKKSVLDIINYDVNIGTDEIPSNFAVHGQASFGDGDKLAGVYINRNVNERVVSGALNVSINTTFDTPLVNLYTSPRSQFIIKTDFNGEGLTIRTLSSTIGYGDALMIRNNHTSNVKGANISTTKYANSVKVYNKLEAKDTEITGILKIATNSEYRRNGIDLDNVKLRTNESNNLNIAVNSICFGSSFDKMAWLKYDEKKDIILLDSSKASNGSLSTTLLNTNLAVTGKATIYGNASVSGTLNASNTTVGALTANNTIINGTLTVKRNSYFEYPLNAQNQLVLDNVLYMQNKACINYSFKKTTDLVFNGVNIACIPVMLEMTSFDKCANEYFKCDINVYYCGKTKLLSGFIQNGNTPNWPRSTPDWCKKLVRFHLYGKNDNDLRIEPYYIDENPKNGGPEYITSESKLIVPAYPNTQILGIRSKSSYRTKICNRWNDKHKLYSPGVQIWLCDNNNNNIEETKWNKNVTLLIYLLAYVNYNDI